MFDCSEIPTEEDNRITREKAKESVDVDDKFNNEFRCFADFLGVYAEVRYHSSDISYTNSYGLELQLLKDKNLTIPTKESLIRWQLYKLDKEIDLINIFNGLSYKTTIGEFIASLSDKNIFHYYCLRYSEIEFLLVSGGALEFKHIIDGAGLSANYIRISKSDLEEVVRKNIDITFDLDKLLVDKIKERDDLLEKNKLFFVEKQINFLNRCISDVYDRQLKIREAVEQANRNKSYDFISKSGLMNVFIQFRYDELNELKGMEEVVNRIKRHLEYINYHPNAELSENDIKAVEVDKWEVTQKPMINEPFVL